MLWLYFRRFLNGAACLVLSLMGRLDMNFETELGNPGCVRRRRDFSE
jgi:hypothetical protein